jgi:hypothetical protein
MQSLPGLADVCPGLEASGACPRSAARLGDVVRLPAGAAPAGLGGSPSDDVRLLPVVVRGSRHDLEPRWAQEVVRRSARLRECQWPGSVQGL